MKNPFSTKRAEESLASLSNNQIVAYAIVVLIVLYIGLIGTLLVILGDDEFSIWEFIIFLCLFIGTLELSIFARAGWGEVFRMRRST